MADNEKENKNDKNPSPEEEERELLLKEYAEAGLVTRQHEQLTRTCVQIFIPALGTLAGYVISNHFENIVLGGLLLFGAVVSLLVALIVRRHQLYYKKYMDRLHEIEKRLTVNSLQVIMLYTKGKEVSEEDPFCWSNKDLIVWFFIFFAFVFLMLAFLRMPD